MPEPTKRYFYKDDTTNDVLYAVIKFDPAPGDGQSDQYAEMPYDGSDITSIEMTAKAVNWNELNSFTEPSEQGWLAMFGDLVSDNFRIGARYPKPTT
jgi:hypothetical protein